jgi:UDP-N-acetylmuramate dehydrogenase
MIYPSNTVELQKVISFAHAHSIPYFTIGRGSNLLIRDGGVRGIVIKLSQGFKTIKIIETVKNQIKLLVGSGVSLRRLLSFSIEKGLTGAEFLSGIPGSMGGAVTMNSGALGRCVKDFTESLTLITSRAEVVEKKARQLTFDYRKLHLAPGTIILNTLIHMTQGNQKEILSVIEKNKKWRSRTQPLNLPSAGSVFKNPSEKPAGYLIEHAGLKGHQVGRAKISEKHANFIVNLGGATACDILTLIETVTQRVYQKTKIRLEPEIKIAGEDGKPCT